MPMFTNISDLSNYLNSTAGQSAVMGTASAQAILRRQAERLKQCIIKRVNDYYSSYTPVMYDRTYGLLSSLEIDNDIEVSIDSRNLTLNIGFSGEDAYRPSLYGSEDAYTPSLINYGWQVHKDVWFQNIYHMGYFEGAHFLENGVADWQSGDTEGVKVIKIYNKY